MALNNLRHRIAIQANTPSVSATGGVTESWATIETVYGDVRPISGRERLIAGQDGAEVTHMVTLRYRTDFGDSDVALTTDHRLQYASRDFEVTAVIDKDERHRFLEVWARERA